MGRLDQRRPPGPRFDPFSLLARGFPADTLSVFVEAAREYGDVVCLRAGPWAAYLVTHPSHVNHVLHDNQKNYDKHDRINSVLKPVLGEGLLTSDGSLWRQQRRLMQPAFRPQPVAALGTLVTDATAATMERWCSHAETSQPLEILTEMRALTFGILAKGFFGSGLEYTTEIDHAAKIFFEFFDYESRHIVSLPLKVPTPRNRRFRRAFAAVDQVIDGIIDARRSSGESRDDLLALLLEADSAGTMGDRHEQLRDEVATLMRVGYETPAVSLTWMWYLVALYREVEGRLHDELAGVLGGRRPTVDDVPRLTYLRAVLEESMRLYPPVWALSRRAIRDDEIGGYHIPANTQVIVCPYITHRHASAWDNPETFDPARFAPERVATRPRGAFVPFGDGPRRCIGDVFAMLAMQLIVATIAQEYSLQLVPGRSVVASPLFTLRPRDGVPVTVHARRPSARAGHDDDGRPV